MAICTWIIMVIWVATHYSTGGYCCFGFRGTSCFHLPVCSGHEKSCFPTIPCLLFLLAWVELYLLSLSYRYEWPFSMCMLLMSILKMMAGCSSEIYVSTGKTQGVTTQKT
jgi:hypothetical protein